MTKPAELKASLWNLWKSSKYIDTVRVKAGPSKESFLKCEPSKGGQEKVEG